MALIRERDTGTPIRVSDHMVSLTIDGVATSVPRGTSVMAAASLMGTAIPKLCATDSLEPFGSCRLCLVEVEGRRGTPASCTTVAEPGMVVRTQTPKLAKLRRGVMELYISDHPLTCLTCSANGDCELQDMAGAVGLREVRYGEAGASHRDAPTDSSNPYFTFESAKCIVCNRCVRACEEVQGTFALTIDGRGFDAKVSFGGTDVFGSECVSCGACVQACPTATLNETSVIALGVPEHSAVTTCAYCGVGCSFKAEMQGEQVVRMVPFKGGKANEGHSCVKGRFAYGYATHRDRITTPMVRDAITDPWRVVSWEEAIRTAAERFRAIQDRHGRDAVGAIASSRCTNEEAYLVQKLVRAAFGNNNVDTCARVCHSPTGYGLKATVGTFGGHAGLRLGGRGRRDLRHRRQPDRRPPGVRLAHEAPPARRRAPHRGGPAPHRPRAHAPTSPRTTTSSSAPAPTWRCSTPWRMSWSRKGWSTRATCGPAATSATSKSGRASWRRRATRPRGAPASPACRPRRSAPPPGSTPPAARPRSTTGSASPSTARARRPSWPWPTSPWRLATSAIPGPA